MNRQQEEVWERLTRILSTKEAVKPSVGAPVVIAKAQGTNLVRPN
jgi:hypothetical protein